MSSRALRRLREEQEQNEQTLNNEVVGVGVGSEDEEEEYESEDDHDRRAKRSEAFQFMMGDSDSDSSDEDEDEDEDGSDEGSKSSGGGITEIEDTPSSSSAVHDVTNEEGEHRKGNEIANVSKNVGKNDKQEEQEEEEDLDAILSEFQNDTVNENNANASNNKNVVATKYSVVLYNNDVRDYDIENALRNMLNGTPHSETQTNNANANANARRNRRSKNNMFARQRDDWGKRPSSFIGGGLGMNLTNLSDEAAAVAAAVAVDPTKSEGKEPTLDIPWPYNDESMVPTDIQQWYTFDRSSTYTDKINDYSKYIANTGDINTMAMYIADNPFVVEPMFHFAMFFFSIGENDRGMELLKRILWVLESATLSSFLRGHENDKVLHLMNGEKEENDVFFSTLFRLAQTSCMIGCVPTSLAISRLLLSLDPMRDPCGVLMVLDYYALATMKEKDVQFLIDLVDADAVKICDKSSEDDETHVCELRAMPNWAFSYALALYRKSHWDEDDNEADNNTESMDQKAKAALDYALSHFPFIPRMMLEKNNVNLKARSFRADWPFVMGPLDEIERNANQGVDKIAAIFVERNYKLWSGDDVLKWMYDGCHRLLQKKEEGQLNTHCPSLALLRYLEFDPIDFQDSFQRIPLEANPLDPGLMDAALHYTPNRRRFLRMNRGQGGGLDGGMDLEMVGRQGPQRLLGTGRDGMDLIDPDLPLLEVFLRSLLPWARVDGVLAPTR